MALGTAFHGGNGFLLPVAFCSFEAPGGPNLGGKLAPRDGELIRRGGQEQRNEKVRWWIHPECGWQFGEEGSK